MRHVRFCMCLAVALALSGAGASAASAETPEYGRCVKSLPKPGGYATGGCTSVDTVDNDGAFEWVPGAVKARFSAAGGAAVFQQVKSESNARMPCKSVSATGEYTGPKTVGNVVMTFTGCEFVPLLCESPGAEEGKAITPALSGELVWSKRARKTVALDLRPPSGVLFLDVACGGFLFKVKGSVLVNVQTGSMLTVTTQKYAATRGVQKPSEYETSGGEQIADFLEMSAGGGPYVQTGLALTNTQTNEERLEVNWFA